MRYATAFLDHGVLVSLALPSLGSRSGSLRWPIACLFGVLLCLWQTWWKRYLVTRGVSLVLLSHTRALLLLSRLRRWWGATTAALLAMNRTLLLQAPRAPAPASHPTQMLGSSNHRSGRAGAAFGVGSEGRPAALSKGWGGQRGASGSDRHPRQPPGNHSAGVELVL